MSSSFANMMMARAFEVSSSLLMILSNSPGLGSLGIFRDCAMHTPPASKKRNRDRINHLFWRQQFALFMYSLSWTQYSWPTVLGFQMKSSRRLRKSTLIWKSGSSCQTLCLLASPACWTRLSQHCWVRHSTKTQVESSSATWIIDYMTDPSVAETGVGRLEILWYHSNLTLHILLVLA